MIKEYGYEFDAEIDELLLNKPYKFVTDKKYKDAFCLRSGRDALKVVAREYRKALVLLPALSCYSMILPFKQYEHDIVFYRLNRNYSADIHDFERVLEAKYQTVILLYIDYFGRKSISDDNLRNLRKKYNNIIFLKDITHTLLNNDISNFRPDYIIASIRKWLAIPDGGLLWCNRPLNNANFAKDFSFTENRLKAQVLRNEFLKTGNIELKKQYRKIFTDVSELLDTNKEPYCMSEYSYQKVLNADWNSIRKHRKINADILISILSKFNITLIQGKSGISDLYVPFITKDRDNLQSKLSLKSVFNTIIWPVSEEQTVTCSVTKNTVDNMLAAPCDQRYSEEDMNFIGLEIVRTINEQKNNDFRS